MPRKTLRRATTTSAWSPGFNEAAARCRGKLPFDSPRPGGAQEASMRPRPDAAENGAAVARSKRQPAGFNEAAARCRGKPGRRGIVKKDIAELQ